MDVEEQNAMPKKATPKNKMKTERYQMVSGLGLTWFVVCPAKRGCGQCTWAIYC
jgi:hypothetical protein